MTTEKLLTDDKLVDMTFNTTLTGLTDKWLYKLIKDGAFPKPIKVDRSSRWLQSKVEKWLKERINSSRSQNNITTYSNYDQKELITSLKN